MSEEHQVQIVNEWAPARDKLIVGCQYKDIKITREIAYRDLIKEPFEEKDSTLTKNAIFDTLIQLLGQIVLPESQRKIVKEFIKECLNEEPD